VKAGQRRLFSSLDAANALSALQLGHEDFPVAGLAGGCRGADHLDHLLNLAVCNGHLGLGARW
jgi:hypothetical protein